MYNCIDLPTSNGALPALLPPCGDVSRVHHLPQVVPFPEGKPSGQEQVLFRHLATPDVRKLHCSSSSHQSPRYAVSQGNQCHGAAPKIREKTPDPAHSRPGALPGRYGISAVRFTKRAQQRLPTHLLYFVSPVYEEIKL